ncbi:hypothetical protein Esti_001282 [Eimeria stiedai]
MCRRALCQVYSAMPCPSKHSASLRPASAASMREPEKDGEKRLGPELTIDGVPLSTERVVRTIHSQLQHLAQHQSLLSLASSDAGEESHKKRVISGHSKSAVQKFKSPCALGALRGPWSIPKLEDVDVAKAESIYFPFVCDTHGGHVKLEEGGKCQNSVGGQNSVGAETGTDFDMIPPWAALHLGSHNLSVCSPADPEISATAALTAATRPLKAQVQLHKQFRVSRRGSVLPRRQTFSVFREWLAEHRHFSTAGCSRVQYPARRGLSQSAKTRTFWKVGSATAEQRELAERRARHAVEAEVEQLSISQTPQQQQEAFRKAQQQAASIDNSRRKLLEGCLGRVADTGDTKAETNPASASVAHTRQLWGQKQEQALSVQPKVAGMRETPRSAATPSTQKQPGSRARRTYSEATDDPVRRREGGNRYKSRKQPILDACEPAVTSEDDGILPKSTEIVARVPRSASFPRTLTGRASPASETAGHCFLAKTPKGGTALPRALKQTVALNYLDDTSLGSGEEEEIQQFNPLNEVLLLLYKARKTEGYIFSTSQDLSNQKEILYSMKGCWMMNPHQKKPTSASEDNRSLSVSVMPAGPKKYKPPGSFHPREQHAESATLRRALSNPKFLPLEAFDQPEDYGEPSPRRLLERCRSECHLRRTKAKPQKANDLQNPVFSKHEAECSKCTSHVCVIPGALDGGTKEFCSMVPAGDALWGQSDETTSQGFEVPASCKMSNGGAPSVPHELSSRPRGEATHQPSEDTAEAEEEASPQQCGSEEEMAEGEVLHFVDKSWKRIPCVVLRYDSTQRKFEVKLNDGTLKTVRRLALRFCFEAPQQQQQRLELCIARRQQMLLRQQFLHSVNSLPSTSFSALPQNIIASIVKAALAIDRLRRRPFPVETLRPAVKRLREGFLEAEKLSAVIYCAESLRTKGLLPLALQNFRLHQQPERGQPHSASTQVQSGESSPLLRLLQPLLSTPPPAVGRPVIGAGEKFHGATVALRKKPLFASPKTLKLSLLLVGKFCELAGLCFFDLPSRKVQRLSYARVFKRSAALKPPDWRLPAPDQYLLYQQALAYDVAEALRELARDSLCHSLISNLNPLRTTKRVAAGVALTAPGPAAAAAHATTSTGPTTAESALHRQLVRFNLMLKSGLLSFVLDSIDSWKLYMLRAIQDAMHPAFQEAAASAPGASSAAGFCIKGNVPCLLQLDITLLNGSAVFHPPLEKQVKLASAIVVEAILRKVLESMVHAVGTINKLEADLVPFAMAAEEPLLPLSLSEPCLKEADAAMVSALHASAKAAEPLRQQLEEVSSVLKEPPALFLTERGDLDLQKLQSDLASYDCAKQKLQSLPTRGTARLFVIDCGKAKLTLRYHARRLQEQLCNKAMIWLENEIHGLHEQWTKALNKASAVPSNEQELVALKAYLSEIDKETASLELRSQTVFKVLSLLEEYSVFVPARLQKQAFELDCCPMRLKMALCETHGILELAKERLEAKRVLTVQQLQSEFESLQMDVEASAAAFKHVEESSTYMPLLGKLRSRIQSARAEVEGLRKAEGLFGLEISEFQQLESVCVPFNRLDELWTAASTFVQCREEWLATPIAKLDAVEMEGKLQQWRQAVSTVRRMSGVFRSVEPLQACDELLQGIAKIHKLLPLIKTLTHPAFQVKHWQQLWSILKLSAAFEREKIALTLNILLQQDLSEVSQTIESIGSIALREFRTRMCFQKMRAAWRALQIELVTFRPGDTRYRILRGFDLVRMLMEEHHTSVQSLQASQLVVGTELHAREWIRKLSDIESLCSLLESFQTSWIYLIPIFEYPEIQRELSMEAHGLEAISTFWAEEVVTRLDESASLLDLTEQEGLPQKLDASCKEMAVILRSLNDFLDKKRLAFPRFFFLSNEELVRLLAGASKPHALMPHIRKCFEGIHSLHLSQESAEALAIRSYNGEVLPLRRPIRLLADGGSLTIDQVFSSIEREMCAALQRVMQQAWEDFPLASSTQAWSTEACACTQAALAIAHCCWTAQVETAILQQKLPQLVKELRYQLQQLVEAIRGPLSQTSRSTLAALMTIKVHCRDVTEELLHQQTDRVEQFQWICHLRSYWAADLDPLTTGSGRRDLIYGRMEGEKERELAVPGGLQLRMLESSLNYGFELLRSPDRLVVTPLTDRCYRTLMTALHFQHGGAPEGPAGTGKTETIKDLSKAAGKPCLVFNCSEGLDAKSLAGLLKGLAAGGGWCCFDEFNRLQLDVLSIVALQISCIQQAIRRKALMFVFEDTDLRLNAACAINITMNPGYAGWSILPDTLKASRNPTPQASFAISGARQALFRPCAMMAPDLGLIAEVMLYCNGFQQAHELSRKMVTCLRLASEQLSSCSHYDFGMRAAVAVLSTAKRLFPEGFRTADEKQSDWQQETTRQEARTICKALRSANIPKLLPADQRGFEEILKDFFEKDDLVDPECQNPLEPFLIQAASSLKVEASKTFVSKALQVLDTVEHRHGLMLVGISAAGKTTVLKCLVLALEMKKAAQLAAENATLEEHSIDAAFQNTACICRGVFPKALDVEELYGSFDVTTRYWKGGALEQAVREASVAENHDSRQWIILDGPVDVGWVENLNTVLDDNKKLCLSSGEVVHLSPQTALLFEVTDLRCASPATVSRCGMVYFHHQVLPWENIIDSWCRHSTTAALLGEKVAAKVKQTFRECCAICAEFLVKRSAGALEMTPTWMVLNVLRIFEAVVTQTIQETLVGDREEVAETLEQSLENAMAFAILWGAGGTLSAADRPAFDVAFRSLHSGRFESLIQMGLLPATFAVSEECEEPSKNLKPSRRFTQHLPPTGSCFDVFWNSQQNKWLPWSSLTYMPELRRSSPMSASALQDVLIETPETALIGYFINLLPAHGSVHLLLAGEAGCGKSKCTMQLLHRRALEGEEPNLQQAQKTVTTQQHAGDCNSNASSSPGPLENAECGFAPLALSLTGASTPTTTRNWLRSRLERTRTGSLRPLKNQRRILLIDDVHLPTMEECGAQPVGEVLRQLLDCGGLHQRGTWRLCRADGLTLCATCRVGQQRHRQMSDRLTRHFVPILSTPYSPDSLSSILHHLLLLRFEKCSEEVVSSLKSISSLTAQLYSHVQHRLPPLPARWTQQWSMRDCWRIIQRMACLSQVGLVSRHQLLRCWLHEVRRVMEDRICSQPDLDILAGAIVDALRDTTGLTPADLDLPGNGPLLFAFREADAGEAARTLPIAIATEDDIVGSRLYQETDVSVAQCLCADGLAQYSLMHPKSPLSLVLFPQVIEHALRCMNTLLQPQGHMLLLGIGGSGRRSVARLGAFLANFAVVEPHGAPHQIALSEWQEDLKGVILATGALRKLNLLMLQGGHLLKDEIAADVCTLLHLRELPEVFTSEEKAEALEAMRGKPSAGAQGLDGPVTETSGRFNHLMDILVAECRQRLRVCICCTPSDSQTQLLLRKFPALAGCCTVNYFRRWASEALYSVARKKLLHVSHAIQHQSQLLRSALANADAGEDQTEQNVEYSDGMQDSKLKDLCEACTDIFEATRGIADLYREELRRFFYVTPSSYLRFLERVCSIYTELLTHQQQRQDQYISGLRKLREMSVQVMEMQHQLEQLQPELLKTSNDTKQLMHVLTTKQEHAASTMALVEAEERECKSQADARALVERECQEQLVGVMPALLAAEQALKKLSKADLTELKSMQAPPAGVVKVMEALCKLFGVQPNLVRGAPGQPRQVDYWLTGKKHLLGNSRFLQRLLEFDRDAIAPSVMAALSPYEEDADFDPEVIKKASVAATSLCLWIKALIAYDRAACAVRPRRAALQHAQCELQTARALLREKKHELHSLEALIEQLSTQYQQSLQHSENIQQEVRKFQARLEVAEKLIASLGGESTRWSQSFETLKKQAECIIGDSTLSAAFMEFGGVFRPSYRSRCLTRWKEALEKHGLVVKLNYSLQDALSTPEQVQQWVMQGLPNDELSIQNATIILRTQCCPMLIDPHQQAVQWLAQTFPDMKVLRAEEPNLLRSLQLMVQCGALVVIECFSENVDPSLNPLLELKRPIQAQRTFSGLDVTGAARGDEPALERAPSSVAFGNSIVEINPSFRLLLQTPLNAPHFSPEVCARLTLVDFSIACKGLEQRLLGLALQAAAPNIHATCLRLVRESAETRAQLTAAEQRMLEALSDAKEDVLEDLELLNILRHAKAVSESCAERLQEQQKAQAAADATLSLYTPCAQRAASFFQVLQQLESVHPMYLFSVQTFQHCFVASKQDASQQQQDICLYTSELMAATLRKVYWCVSPCLFERHKPLLRVLLALQSLTLRKAVRRDELQQLFAPAFPPSADSPETVPDADQKLPSSSEATSMNWLTESARQRLHGLQRLGEPFVQLAASVLEDAGDWEAALYEENPLASAWPEQWGERLSLVQQTLLVQCVRPECLCNCLQVLAEAELGFILANVVPLRMDEALDLAGSKAPLVILLAPGADPQAALLQLAEVAHMRNKFVTVAMGEGQGPKAVSAICSSAETGQWVLLQNCHLGRSFLKQLSILVSDLATQNPHKDFRLILTTAPCEEFPSAILLRSVKLAYEAPRGLRDNLLRIYSEVTLDWLDSHPRGTLLRPMVFRLCFLHALLLGRRRFGPLGWVSPVNFLASDLLISLQQLQTSVTPDSVNPLPWALLQYLASDINYGGRVADEWDRRLLRHLCSEVLVEETLPPDSAPPSSRPFTALPPDLSCAETLAFIRSLPAEEPPEVFGLHPNAALAIAATESSTMQQLLTRVHQQQGAALEREATKAEASSTFGMGESSSIVLAQMPPLFDIREAAASRPHAYENAMDAVLLQELARYNALISLAVEILKIPIDAAGGLIEYTPQVEELNQCLQQNRVPQVVAAASYPTAFSLSTWLVDLKKRVDFMKLWLREGPPHPFWLPGCFSARSVCTAMLQTFARYKGLKINAVAFSFVVLPEEKSETGSVSSQGKQQRDETQAPPPFAHDISGLFLHGAAWSSENMALIEQDYWEFFAPLPLLRFQPTHVGSQCRPPRAYECPLYCTSKRSDTRTTSGVAKNFILSVPLPILDEDTEAMWAKRGAALVAQPEE